MTAFPTGKSIDWGPFLPFITATIAIIFGMTARPDMMLLSSWLIPLFASMMVPVTYFIGKYLWDWKTGIVASGLISVTSGIYFISTTFGYVDHHMFEALFGAFFCLMYIVTLKYAWKNYQNIKLQRELLIFSGLALLTASIFFVGYLNMPTMILFGLIVAIFTFFQFIRARLENKLDQSLILTNIGIFSLIIVLLVIFGVKQEGFSLQQYSIGHIIAILFILGETLVMYALAKRLNRNTGVYILAVIAVSIGIFLAILAISRETFYQLITLFGQSETISTITESQPWNIDIAFSTFNLMLIISFIGFLLLVIDVYSKKLQEHLFFMIWSLIIFILTVQHLRFEYYFAVNVTLLAGLCIVTGLKTGFTYTGNLTFLKYPEQKNTESENNTPLLKKQSKKGLKSTKMGKKSLSTSRKNKKILGVFIISAILGATFISVGLSIQGDMEYSSSHFLLINDNWVETTTWLETHTPNPGIDYSGVYQEDQFSYPSTAYGILSWWDFGHYITYIGKRIPVSNPFQDHLAGPNGAAAFYIANSETDALNILQSMGARFVITDTSLATDKFEPLVTWNDRKADVFSYMKSFFTPDPKNPGQLLQINGEFPPYFKTMIVRLHNFDGSMQIPGKVAYLEYYDENRNGLFYPMVTTAKNLDVQDAKTAIKYFEKQPKGNSKVILVGQFLRPMEQVSALQHFRLIHESPGNSLNIQIHDSSGAENLNLVKIFEIVKGAHIKGEGTIELQMVTNTGRNFTYRQESSNGEFIVPYSTVNNPYDVTANGKYHILGTNIGIDVTEEDIIGGKYVQY
jgi:dolichyl-diphosphooligosaccharide--protein glycosyltransferase